jgi:hypothetical protein
MSALLVEIGIVETSGDTTPSSAPPKSIRLTYMRSLRRILARRLYKPRPKKALTRRQYRPTGRRGLIKRTLTMSAA